MWVIEKMGKFDEPPAIREEKETEFINERNVMELLTLTLAALKGWEQKLR